MRSCRGFEWLAPVLSALGVLAFAAVFFVETGSFRRAVLSWAERDLATRTALASDNLREPLQTGDFRRIHAFGDACAADGMRLTVFSAPGGVFFDSLVRGAPEPEALYAVRPCGEFRVRLGLPLARVLAPFERAKVGFLLAALVGAAGVLLVFLVTYRQRVRIRELARLEAFRREFIADVSHEIKTPLTGILGAVDLLGDDDATMRPRLLEMIRRESGRLNGLVQSILDLARLEREGEVLERTETDLAALVREAVEVFAPACRVRVRLAAEDPRLVCDARLVLQALTNLIGNAVRHSGTDDIEVALEGDERTVRLVVEDHGIGIPSEHAVRIFERFHRVDPSRAASSGGAGLGLAIVRRVAERHGGRVGLEPARPTGCRFVLELPRLAAVGWKG